MVVNFLFKIFSDVNLFILETTPQTTPQITPENFCARASGIMKLIGRVLEIFEYVVPVVVLVFAVVDLGKAVIVGEEKEIKVAQKMLIKRLVFGVALFFSIVLVKSAFSLIDEAKEVSINSTCWSCVVNPSECDTTCSKKENYSKEECK